MRESVVSYDATKCCTLGWRGEGTTESFGVENFVVVRNYYCRGTMIVANWFKVRKRRF